MVVIIVLYLFVEVMIFMKIEQICKDLKFSGIKVILLTQPERTYYKAIRIKYLSIDRSSVFFLSKVFTLMPVYRLLSGRIYTECIVFYIYVRI